MAWKFINRPLSERNDDSNEEDAAFLKFQVSSTCIAKASFKSDGPTGLGFAGSGNLFITFVEDQRRYKYSDFPTIEFESFRVSASKGDFFNRNIRTQYSYEEIGLGEGDE